VARHEKNQDISNLFFATTQELALKSIKTCSINCNCNNIDRLMAKFGPISFVNAREARCFQIFVFSKKLNLALNNAQNSRFRAASVVWYVEITFRTPQSPKLAFYFADRFEVRQKTKT